MLLRSTRFEDAQGRRSLLEERRLVSMDNMHLGALEVTLTAENWSADVTIRTAIEGASSTRARNYIQSSIRNISCRKPKKALAPMPCRCWFGPANRTCASPRLRERRRSSTGGVSTVKRRAVEEAGYIGHELTAELKQGATLALEKLVSLYTSRDRGISESPDSRRARRSRARRGSRRWWPTTFGRGGISGAASTFMWSRNSQEE